MVTEHTPRPARRAVEPAERGKAADRTREKILRAAVEEFGAKGYSGARTAGIAARAGVNQQLISYHFGGKQGLLDALRRDWAAAQETRSAPGASFAESFGAYLDVVGDQPDWSRLVLWQALGDDPGGSEEQAEALRTRLAGSVERVAGRQRDGEITDGVDPEFVMLLSYVLAFAPIALPQHVAGITGRDPLAPDYRTWVRDQLLALLAP
ncbi:hypothetical protein Lfu02_08740 [Longispora fulva]|uniref:AcrR family transcriptional regulator n=1 Tax=Longispora fulva TaxID=619741 RepID=A0A8J7KJA5_9ACTN|nr:TetR/AcrR family transcriptional regulator [Longispora fulva]MBG6135261.1 AcrR family transcriptional regulator [Longispora fulva]GIG56502.1 hypothetical protein Lfu02_08740 [Longispora fulva]